MRDYNIIDEDLFEVSCDDENMDREQKIYKKLFKYVKILAYAVLGPGGMRASYRTSNAKEKNTDYLNRFSDF